MRTGESEVIAIGHGMIDKDSLCPCSSGKSFGDCHGDSNTESNVERNTSNKPKDETFNMRPSGAEVTVSHHFFRWKGASPDERTLRDLALRLANYYLSQPGRSRKQWLKDKTRRVCRWEAPRGPGRASISGRDTVQDIVFVQHSSEPLTLRDFERELKGGKFDYQKLGLPAPSTHWLDSSVNFIPNFHATSNTRPRAMAFRAESLLGPRFPVTPRIDREGLVRNSFQKTLLTRIASLRAELVAKSDELASEEWFQGFRALVAECVSLIDGTLHQIYFKAKYDPLPGWTFDETRLERRHGGRVNDKFKWVFKITNHELHARDERRDFEKIKALRNHLQHFDPPALAFTFEEMATWLNCVRSVAMLNLKIRDCVGALPDPALIELLLQREIEFCPRDSGKQRVPHPADVGYASTDEAAMARPGPLDCDDIVIHSHAGLHRLLT